MYRKNMKALSRRYTAMRMMRIEMEELEQEKMEVLQIAQNQNRDKEDKYYFAEEIEEEETLSFAGQGTGTH
jgi:hypothetical protein